MLHTKFRGNRSNGYGEDFEGFLAHLSQRLIGELIVCEGICRPSIVCQHFQTTSLKP